MSWFGHLIRMPFGASPFGGGLVGTSSWEENLGVDLELAGLIFVYLLWPGDTLEFPMRSWKTLLL